MKIATFNIQNLFHRDKLLIKENRLHNDHTRTQEFEKLVQVKNKTAGDYSRMHELAGLIGLNTKPFDSYLSMKNIDGTIVVSSNKNGPTKKASYQTNWEGWIKINNTPINEKALAHKAKVIIETNPDILILQEVENRSSISEFNSRFLGNTTDKIYDQFVHMEGNDPKGLGMSVLLKSGYNIKSMKSFANETDEDGSFLFEKDLQQYKIEDSCGKYLYILNCHFDSHSDSKRKRQANRIIEIYYELKTTGNENIIILGTFNAPSFSDSLSPLFNGSGLRDVVKHTSFMADKDTGSDSTYFRLGAYRKGVNLIQKDYMLVPSSLFDKIKGSGMNRRAIWPLTQPKWPTYKSLEKEAYAASEHPLLWVDIIIDDCHQLFKKSA